MLIASAEIKLTAPWVNSLKEKRMVVKSLTAKIQNRFHCSAAETAEQDVHRTIVLGVACIAGNPAQADSILDHILNFVEANTEAEIVEVRREIR